MEMIGDRIQYLPAVNDPLSADVYFIEGDKYCYIYDVGNNEDSLHHINRISKEMVVILSHYHKDHVGNADHVDDCGLYVGKKTYETIGKGTILENRMEIHDGVNLEIMPCPSPHTDGSLIVNVDREYTLIADLYFTRPPFEMEKALQMLEFLKNIDTKYFVVSHQEDDKIVPKEKLIAALSDYFNG